MIKESYEEFSARIDRERVEFDRKNDPNTITLKRIYSTHCQVCGRPHDQLQLVYFIPIDNNLVCGWCAKTSRQEYEPRIYKEGE